jgi:hypothetical protein
MRKALVFVVSAVMAHAQRIDTEKSDPHKIVRIATSPNHLSVIELAEPVVEVAAGSSSYKIEWRENKVFIQPLDPGATTNLFIWTASGRQSYELVPADSVQDMQFAIDQEPPPQVSKIVLPAKPIEDSQATKEAKLATNMLFGSTPVHLAGRMKGRTGVEVIVQDVYRTDGKVFVRYAIQNQGQSSYQPGTPSVFSLRSPQSQTSLYALTSSQLVGDALRIRSNGQTPVKVVSTQLRPNAVAPGETAWGVVALELPPVPSRPIVLRFTFQPDDDGEVTAVLVL